MQQVCQEFQLQQGLKMFNTVFWIAQASPCTIRLLYVVNTRQQSKGRQLRLKRTSRSILVKAGSHSYELDLQRRSLLLLVQRCKVVSVCGG